MPGGEAVVPGDGVSLPTCGGGAPQPGGYWVKAPAVLTTAQTTESATMPLPREVMI